MNLDNSQREARSRPASGYGILLVLLLAVAVPAVPAAAAELRVTIRTIRTDNGEILIGLYDNAAGFERAIANAATRGLTPDPGRLVGTAIRARRGVESTVFTQLPPGRYAVVVIHDENDNGRLDKNAIGMPTEGYGFSNDAHGLLGTAPSFDAAAITLGNADKSISIDVIYPGPQSTESGGGNFGSGSSGPLRGH